jgi:hypothetical protein
MMVKRAKYKQVATCPDCGFFPDSDEVEDGGMPEQNGWSLPDDDGVITCDCGCRFVE